MILPSVAVESFGVTVGFAADSTARTDSRYAVDGSGLRPTSFDQATSRW